MAQPEVYVVLCEMPPLVVGVFDEEANAVKCLEAHLKEDAEEDLLAGDVPPLDDDGDGDGDEVDDDDEDEELPYEGFGGDGRYVIVQLRKNRDYFPPPDEPSTAVPRSDAKRSQVD